MDVLLVSPVIAAVSFFISICAFFLHLYVNLDSLKIVFEKLFTSSTSNPDIHVPSNTMGPDVYRYLYQHRAVRRRNIPDGAVLSELTPYIVVGVHAQHGDLLENEDPAHKHLLRIIKSITGNVDNERLRSLFRECLTEHFDDSFVGRLKVVSLRSFLTPVPMQVSSKIIFGGKLEDEHLPKFCSVVESVVHVLKLRGTHRHTDFDKPIEILTEKLRMSESEVSKRLKAMGSDFPLDHTIRCMFSAMFMIQPLQLCESLAHIILELTRNKDLLDKLHETNFDPGLVNMVIKEGLRLKPLSGTTRRGVVNDIVLPEHLTSDRRLIPAGSIIVFNLVRFHRENWLNADKFRPERWERVESEKDVNYLPFGILGNRPCPCEKIAKIFLQEAIPFILSKYTPISYSANLRLLPSGGVMMLVGRQFHDSHPTLMRLLKVLMRLIDWADRIRIVLLTIIFCPMCFFISQRLSLGTKYYEKLYRAGLVDDKYIYNNVGQK